MSQLTDFLEWIPFKVDAVMWSGSFERLFAMNDKNQVADSEELFPVLFYSSS